MSKSIPLSKGQFAIVDDEDYERVSQYNWYCQQQARGYTSYAVRTEQGKRVPNGPRPKQMIYLHKFVLSLGDEVVDHVNGNGLDCRKNNLRLSTMSKNQHNQGPRRSNTSGYKGVSFAKSKGRWQAMIWFESKPKHLGYFGTAEDAAAAYDAASELYHGEHGYRNLP